ncbi:MAG TPA: hypothetical protein DCL43_08375 [Chitinophagaceae bacterium]|nr:hypothetical protein [Chitinophagaceae bacterium]HAN37806.1 hypothetical protein [Chitinophagaceae bacterium]
MIFCCMLLCIGNSFAQQRIDSFLQLSGVDRYYTLNELYGNNLKNQQVIGRLNALVLQKGNSSDKLIQYFWLEKRPLLDSLKLSPKVFTIYQEMVQKAEAINNHYLAAQYYISMGVNYNTLKAFNRSFESQLYCLDALSKDPTGKYFHQSWWLHIIANKFYEFKDYIKTIELAKIASTIGLQYTPDGHWFQKVNTNLIGMSYLKNQQYDSARNWLQQTLQIASTVRDTVWMGIATGNLGTIHYLQGNYTKAIQLYTQALQWCRQKGIWDNVASFCNNLADCYMLTNKYNAVLPLLNESEIANQKDRNNNSYLANQIKLYTVAERYYRKKNDNKLIIDCADSVKKYQQLYNQHFDITQKIKAEGEFAYRSKDLQNKLLLNENKLQKQTILFGCIVAILTASFIIFYIKRINLRKKIAEQKKALLEQQLQASKKEILDFTHHIVEKNQIIEHYTAEIIALQKQTKSFEQEQTSVLQELKSQTILTQADWVKFKLLFKKVYPNFFSHFKTQYPELTQAEIRFLAFTKLEISPKEMASLLGVSDEAIRTLRYRIKKKLNINDAKEIEQAVATV